MDQDILSNLQSIKLALYCLLATSAASVALGIARVWIARRRYIREAMDKLFADDATKLLAEGKLHDVTRICDQQLAKRPGDTYALWYLGLAQFRLGEHAAARMTFSKLVELAPDWEESHVDPMLAKMTDAGPVTGLN